MDSTRGGCGVKDVVIFGIWKHWRDTVVVVVVGETPFTGVWPFSTGFVAMALYQ